MSLMPLQTVPVPRTPPGLQTSRAVDHSAWVPFGDAGAEQSYSWQNSPIQIPFEDAGAEQSLSWQPYHPFEDAGAEQSWGTSSWNSLDYPFEG